MSIDMISEHLKFYLYILAFCTPVLSEQWAPLTIFLFNKILETINYNIAFLIQHIIKRPEMSRTVFMVVLVTVLESINCSGMIEL